MPTPIAPIVTLPAPVGRGRPVRITRAGVTLLELVIVVAVLALSALVVPPLLRPAARGETNGAEVNGLVVQARREALRRGERVWLRIDGDGAWVLAARQGTEVLRRGQLVMPATAETTTDTTTATATRVIDVTIDALGTCQPGPGRIPRPVNAPPFDMLACSWTVSAVQP